MTTFLINYEFSRASVVNNFVLKRTDSNLVVLQIYVDDIIFGCSSETLNKMFSNLMSFKFEMRFFGEFKFFLILQINRNLIEFLCHKLSMLGFSLDDFYFELSILLESSSQ